MIPTIIAQGEETRKLHGIRHVAMSSCDVRRMWCEWVDDMLAVMFRVDIDEDEPFEYPPPDVATVGIMFDAHEWQAFRAYVDSHFKEQGQ